VRLGGNNDDAEITHYLYDRREKAPVPTHSALRMLRCYKRTRRGNAVPAGINTLKPHCRCPGAGARDKL
jgi:hypothetical protein